MLTEVYIHMWPFNFDAFMLEVLAGLINMLISSQLTHIVQLTVFVSMQQQNRTFSYSEV
jgi:hypothetical protein